MGSPFLGDFEGVDKETGKFMFSLEANNLVDEVSTKVWNFVRISAPHHSIDENILFALHFDHLFQERRKQASEDAILWKWMGAWWRFRKGTEEERTRNK
jgi:hypothetical protein